MCVEGPCQAPQSRVTLGSASPPLARRNALPIVTRFSRACLRGSPHYLPSGEKSPRIGPATLARPEGNALRGGQGERVTPEHIGNVSALHAQAYIE